MARNKHKKPVLSREEQKARVEADGVLRTTLSFYLYTTILDPIVFRNRLYDALASFGCFGRIYVAREGINAQMNVPEKNWERFDTYIQGLPELAGVPYKIAVEESSAPSFYKLTVKVKEKIVADGLDDSSFDPSDTGEYLSAAEFNKYIDDPDAVVVDMRNNYESAIGHFENAITPDAETFREELMITPDLLARYKNKKVGLYCTGGIRCEKASAYLKHVGFTDVRHLKGGIIDYKHQVDEANLPNKFKGKNFVFDERMGERIGEEIISDCQLCGTVKCDDYRHCNNQACHILYISCESCTKKYNGYCSRKCQVFDMLPERIKKLLTRNHFKKDLPQFKKNRLRPKAS